MKDKLYRVKRKTTTWEVREVVAKNKQQVVDAIVSSPEEGWNKLQDISIYWDKNRVELVDRLEEETNV